MSERKTLTYSSSGSIKTHKALPAHTHQHQHTNIYSQTHISCVCCTQYKRCCSLPFVIELICYFLLLRRHRRCCFSPYLHTYVFFFVAVFPIYRTHFVLVAAAYMYIFGRILIDGKNNIGNFVFVENQLKAHTTAFSSVRLDVVYEFSYVRRRQRMDSFNGVCISLSSFCLSACVWHMRRSSPGALSEVVRFKAIYNSMVFISRCTRKFNKIGENALTLMLEIRRAWARARERKRKVAARTFPIACIHVIYVYFCCWCLFFILLDLNVCVMLCVFFRCLISYREYP